MPKEDEGKCEMCHKEATFSKIWQGLWQGLDGEKPAIGLKCNSCGQSFTDWLHRVKELKLVVQ